MHDFSRRSLVYIRYLTVSKINPTDRTNHKLYSDLQAMLFLTVNYEIVLAFKSVPSGCINSMGNCQLQIATSPLASSSLCIGACPNQ